MTDEAIGELTRILIKEEFENKNDCKKFILSKKDLIRFCIKVVKIIKRFED